MKKVIFLVVLASFVAGGCGSLHFSAYTDATHFGTETYAPTQHIDVFSSESLVTRPYLEIGMLQCYRGDAQEQLDTMKVNAMKAGADAIANMRYDHVGRDAALVAQAVMLRYK
jgi:hypothetical protein